MKNKYSGFKLNAMALGIMLASSSAYAANTVLVSESNGERSFGSSQSPTLNHDGSKVAFISDSGGLVGDNQILQHVYFKNMSTNTISRVSVNSSGVAANSKSSDPSINGDGRYIAFMSLADNLVSNDLNATGDIFVRDTLSNTTSLVSSNSSAVQANGYSLEPAISKDGKFVAFYSHATNLTSLDTQDKAQVYVKNLQTGQLDIVSINNNGITGNQESFSPSISSDGRFVTFASLANNLGLSAQNQYNIFVHDRQTKTTEIVSAGANNHSSNPIISSNGRFIAFVSFATNLVSDDTNNTIDIIIYDRDLKTYQRAQRSGIEPNAISLSPTLSDDGRFVAFRSAASNLVDGDTNAKDDMFVFDIALNKVERLNIRFNGEQSNSSVNSSIALSGNGKVAAFASADTSMVGVDPWPFLDIFIRQRDPIQSVQPTAQAASVPPQECSNGSAYLTLDGRTSTDITAQGVYTWRGPFGTATGAVTSVYLDVGLHSITLEVTHPWGTDSKTFNIAVVDTKAPSISADAPVTREATSVNGAAYVVGVNASDACKLVGTTVSPSPPYYSLGTTNVTVTATDAVGNIASDTTTVTVEDTTAPALTIPGDISVEANNTRTAVNIGNASATDYFLASVTNSAPVDFPLNTTLVTWTAKDTSGNSTSKLQRVTTIDSTAPELTIPADKSFEATASLTTVNIGSASASDIFPVTITNDAPLKFPVGTSTVNWTATDANNNSISAIQSITLVDSIAPTIVAPADITAEATDIETPLSLISATATDAVGVVEISNNAPAMFPIGDTIVTWTSIDAAGNSSSVAQKVTVQDTTAPVIAAPANVNVEAVNELSVVAFEEPEVSDAVDVVNFTHDAPATFPVGTTNITWTAKDAAGNISTAIQTITVEDTIAPAITQPVNVEVEATAPQSIVAFNAPIATDVVGVTSFTNDAPATFQVGTTTITWTAKDLAGNTSTATQTVTVVDTTKPSITGQVNIEVEATAPRSIVAYNIPIATDIVGVTSFTHDAPATFPVGLTTIIWTAVDAAGNKNTATQTVTVKDTTPPVINAPVNVEVEATAFESIVAYATPPVTDIVGVVSLTNNAPTSFPVGTTIITWTASDAAGNSTTVTQLVKVKDTTPATLTIPADMTVEANGNPSSIASLGIAQANDIVDGDISSNIQITEPENGYVLGANTVSYSIIDKAGNLSTSNQTVTIIDTTAPVFTNTPTALIDVIATSEQTEIAIGNAVASDFYLKSVTNDYPSNQFPVGETVVTWTAEDTSGNKSTFTQIVRASYKFNGFHSPLKEGGIYKAGRVIPVKINLTYADGTPVEVAQPLISMFQTSNQEVVGTALDINSSSAADNGVIMRYTSDGNYIYNLNTATLGKGTYQISVLPHGGNNVNVINIALK